MPKELFGLELTELTAAVEELGMPKFRARQIFQWLYVKSVFDFRQMTNLSKADIEKLATCCTLLPARLNVLQEQRSSDGLTSKLLIELQDGATVETVLMHHDYGYSVCVSSQVGCDMHCAFCASGLKGCERSLQSVEILAQVYLFNARLRLENERVSRVVVMGSGEPMLNFDNVVGALQFLHNGHGANISYRNMTVSTCGIIPGIRKLADLGLPINLAVSLHAVRSELRTELMPVNKGYPFSEVIKAAEEYSQVSGRDVTYEYILLRKKNDSLEDAVLLADYLRFKHASVNLIPANPVPEQGFNRPAEGTVKRFADALAKRRISVTVRREMGSDISAACGQLRNKFQREKCKLE